MSIVIKNLTPTYEQRKEIECVTLRIFQAAQAYLPIRAGVGKNVYSLTARLDEGLATERQVTWNHAQDHPVFVFRKE
jgi:hypothetical protein